MESAVSNRAYRGDVSVGALFTRALGKERGFKPRLPVRCLRRRAFHARTQRDIFVGALCKRAHAKSAVSNRAYRRRIRRHAFHARTQRDIFVGALCKRAVGKERGFKPRLPATYP